MRTITSRAWARKAADTEDPAVDTMYFHLVRTDEPPGLGTPETPPNGARIWKAEDWFDAPAERMFASFIGDCQPSAADGGVLRTSKRLAITAAVAARGHLSSGAWTAVEVEDPNSVLWIESDSGGAVPIAEAAEEERHRGIYPASTGTAAREEPKTSTGPTKPRAPAPSRCGSTR